MTERDRTTKEPTVAEEIAGRIFKGDLLNLEGESVARNDYVEIMTTPKRLTEVEFIETTDGLTVVCRDFTPRQRLPRGVRAVRFSKATDEATVPSGRDVDILPFMYGREEGVRPSREALRGFIVDIGQALQAIGERDSGK
jgi:hypothetical protein